MAIELVRNLFTNVGRLIEGVRVGKRFNSASDGISTMLAGVTGARNVLIVVRIVESFADGDGAQPVFIIGDTSNDDSIIAAAVLPDAVEGSLLTFVGVIVSTEDLIVTSTAATGTGTGAIEIECIVLPPDVVVS